MRSLVLLASVLLLLPPLADAADAPPAFAEAATLYEQQNFAEARDRYETLIESGQRTANVFYNLGNSEYRLKRAGRAALAYERALLLNPMHHEARVNLDLLRQRGGSKTLPPSWIDYALLPFSGPLYAVLTSAFAWTAVLAVAAILLWRRATRRLSVLAGVSFVFALYAATGVWRDHARRQSAVVITPEAQARLEPADRSGVAETLPAGSAVRVLSEHGAWLYCELPGRGRGWISNRALERIAPREVAV